MKNNNHSKLKLNIQSCRCMGEERKTAGENDASIRDFCRSTNKKTNSQGNGFWKIRPHLHGDHFPDPWDLFHEEHLNPLPERHEGARTISACPLKVDLDDPILAHLDQFHVPPVGLEHGPDFIQDFFDFIAHESPDLDPNINPSLRERLKEKSNWALPSPRISLRKARSNRPVRLSRGDPSS
jgi:hypothetical protein